MQKLGSIAHRTSGWLTLWVVLTVLLAVAVAVRGRMQVELDLISISSQYIPLRWWMYPTVGAALAALIFLWTAVAATHARHRGLQAMGKHFEELKEAAIAAVKRHQPDGIRADVDVAMALDVRRGHWEAERGPFEERWSAMLHPFQTTLDWSGNYLYIEGEQSWHGARGLVLRWLVSRRCVDRSGSTWSQCFWNVRYMPHAVEPCDEATRKLETELAEVSQGMPAPSPPEAEDDDDEGSPRSSPWRWDAPRPLESVSEVELEVRNLIPDEYSIPGVKKGITVTAHRVVDPLEGYYVWLNLGDDRELVGGMVLSTSLVYYPGNIRRSDRDAGGAQLIPTLPQLVEAAALKLSRRSEGFHRARPGRGRGRGSLS